MIRGQFLNGTSICKSRLQVMSTICYTPREPERRLANAVSMLAYKSLVGVADVT